jgi:hypothetical protein
VIYHLLKRSEKTRLNAPKKLKNFVSGSFLRWGTDLADAVFEQERAKVLNILKARKGGGGLIVADGAAFSSQVFSVKTASRKAWRV